MPQPTRERLLLKDGHVGFAETQLQIVIKAAALVEPGRVAAYLRLREMAATGRPEEHSLLEARFGEFYGMDGHSPPPGAVLALLQTITRPVTPATYVSLLTALAGLDDTQSRNGRLRTGLASQLVSLRDEGCPIYAGHVTRFFGITVPETGDREYRIALYLDQLEGINRTYMGWATSPGFCRATALLCERIPGLATCHPVRVCDMLVETVVRRWDQAAASGRRPPGE